MSGNGAQEREQEALQSQLAQQKAQLAAQKKKAQQAGISAARRELGGGSLLDGFNQETLG